MDRRTGPTVEEKDRESNSMGPPPDNLVCLQSRLDVLVAECRAEKARKVPREVVNARLTQMHADAFASFVPASANDGLKHREPFAGRWFAILNVEGDGHPLALFPSAEEAERELEVRRSVDPDDDAHLTEFHQVFPCDIAGAMWNSYDPDPRADNPLTIDEIVRVHAGEP